MSSEVVIDQDVTFISRKSNEIIFEESIKRVISEISIRIIINDIPFVSLLCINELPEELALGFLYNEGIIDSMDDVEELSFNELLFAVIITLKRDFRINHTDSLRSITSACGKGITFINPKKSELFEPLQDTMQISIAKIWELMKDFNRRSNLYRTIGGVHSVLFFHKNIAIFNEDIGRHNCVDKIAGILLKKNKMKYISRGLMLSSGRISSEIITKLIRLRVPIVVSRHSPTATAVELAEEYNITLLGYVRGGKAVVYAGKERVLIQTRFS